VKTGQHKDSGQKKRRYVGNTPTEIGLSPGTHVVVLSMPGFADWKRETC